MRRSRPVRDRPEQRGEDRATTTLAAAFAVPSRSVLSALPVPAFAYCLKNTGKNPAMTVVENAEFAQS